MAERMGGGEQRACLGGQPVARPVFEEFGQKPGPLVVVAGFDRSGTRRPVGVEELGQRSGRRVEEAALEEIDQRLGAVEERGLARRLVPGKHRFEQMHMRVGAARQRIPAVLGVTAMDRIGALVVETGKRAVGPLPCFWPFAHAPQPCRGEQNERLIVGVARFVLHRPVGVEQVDETAVGMPAGLGQRRKQALQKPVGHGPAHVLGMGEHVDLAGQHAQPLGVVRRRLAGEIQRLVHAATVLIDAVPGPERQAGLEKP